MHPKERLAITNKIKAIARDHPTFQAADCMLAHMGLYSSGDWDECLDAMVNKGKLFTDGEGDYSLKAFE